MEVIYEKLCPLCGGDLSWEEIETKICETKKIDICLEKEIKPFVEFFTKCICEPREIQKMWAKRVLHGESFALTAPTGIGKTSFGLAISLFLAINGKRCYIIFPTSVLVKQAVENLKSYAEKVGFELTFNETGKFPVGFYHADIEDKEAFFSKIGEFKILITTSQFLAKNFEKLKDLTFDFIFVDDVDAILKASKNVERILSLLGVDRGKNGSLVVSTATAKVGRKSELFRKFLNFTIGSSHFYIRNIEDVIVDKFEDLETILKKLGSGGIIYARNIEECERIYELLREQFRIGIATSKDSKDFELFSKGELDYLVGTAHYYGVLVRGLDLPERIRYAIFIGCPVHRVRLQDLDTVPISVIKVLALTLREDKRLENFIPKLKFAEKIEKELRSVLKEIISESDLEVRDIVVRKGEVIFPDIRTYLQASGRTSRLHAKGLTKGASFVFEDDPEILKAFIQRARYYDISFFPLGSIDLDRLRKEIEESRKKKEGEFEIIKPALLIVESPTKAKQIARFFGKPSIRFIDSIPVYEVPTEKYLLLITATLGHLTDLVINRGYYGVLENFIPVYGTIKRCKKCGNQFTDEENCPKCGSSEIDDAIKRISALRKLSQETEFVIIGTDPDSEGEKIAWDLKNLLCGNIKRAEFHEITKKEITNALNNLREINENLLKAQVVRRIEDRWIGFVLSQKVQNYFGKRHLSAGRAQTPALGWIVERFRANRIRKSVAFIPELDLAIESDQPEFEISIEVIEDKNEIRTPMPPYTTNSLLFDANAILKLSTKRAMEIAQDLFENGLITYHRTDSTRVSEYGMKLAQEYLGENFKGREWFTEGAHECIRPTRAIDRLTLERLIEERVFDVEGFEWAHFALYDLIFRRFMASQCKEFEVRVKKYRIVANGKTFEEERVVEAKGKATELYKSVWVKKELKEGKFRVKAEIRKIPSAQLLTQAELIRLMKERGIGRPSTYAVIVDKLFTRNYVLEKNGKLIPTKDGISVYDFLISNYAPFISESRTRALEEKMDAIERGNIDYLDALKELYEEIKWIE